MNIAQLKKEYDHSVSGRGSNRMSLSQFCSLLTENDSDAMLELHYDLLTRNDRRFAKDLQMYFAFRKNKVKAALFLKEKLKQEKNLSMKKIISSILDDIGYLTIDELKDACRKVRAVKAVAGRLAYSKSLRVVNDREVLDYHYEILTGSDGEFHDYIRTVFADRSDDRSVDSYLLDKLKDATVERDIIDLLRILGHRRVIKSLPYIRKHATSDSAALRNECLIVLGWVGRAGDARIMYAAMESDPVAEIRSTAVYALRQLWYHNDRAETMKDGILTKLYPFLIKEKSVEGRKAAVFVAQELMKKNFGISESRFNELAGYTKEKGDLDAAVEKTVNALGSGSAKKCAVKVK